MARPYGFCLLAPGPLSLGSKLVRHSADSCTYWKLLSGMQYLRGQTYLADGAVSAAELDDAGRLQMSDDEQCWHLLLTEEPSNEVIGCVRFRVHVGKVSFHQLRISQSPVAHDAVLGPKIRRAVESELSLACRQGLSYVEVGGWALAREWRRSKATMDILAGSFALGEIWGGCRGLATATVRHASASMLRRMGASSLDADGEELLPYQDARYGCTMELLRFGRSPVERFDPIVSDLKSMLLNTPAIHAPIAFPAVA